jgi:NitT/TauT family transport system substrate-binding protein
MMPSTTRRNIGIAIVIFVILVCIGWLWSIKSNYRISDDADLPTVQIGYLPIYVDLPLFVAVGEGYFEDEGIHVELSRFAASTEIKDALLSGQVDIGASIAYSVALTVESRDPGQLRIFLIDSENKEGYLSSIVVPDNSPIKEVKDLEGKNVGSFPGPTAVTFFKMVLESYNIDITKVNIVEMPISLHLKALEAGTVDALFTYEPTGTQAVLDHNAIKLLPGAVERTVIDPWQGGVWVVSSRFDKSNSVVVDKVVKAIYRAVLDIKTNPNKAKLWLQQYTAIRKDVALATPNIPFTPPDQADLEAFQRHADILFDKGIISRKINAYGMIRNAALK